MLLSSFWQPWLARTWSIEQCGHHVTGALIGTSRKLAAYNYTSSLALWTTLEYELVDANGVCQGIKRSGQNLLPGVRLALDVNNINNVNNLTAPRKGLQRFWLHPRDRHQAMTQTYNNCAETHFGGGYEPSCLPVVRHRSSAWSGSVALRKGPRRFCPHHSDRCRALMLTYRNSHLWQRYERCNNVLSLFWPPWLARTNLINWTAWLSRDMCLNWNEQPSALNDAWVRVGECKPSLPRYPKGQSRPCYQECGCHV